MRVVLVSVIAVLFSASASASAGEPLKWVKPPELTFNETAKKWHVTFELESLSDALLGHSSTTMLHRHYAHLLANTKALHDALRCVR